MHTVGCPRQRGPRPRHIKGLPGAESRGAAVLPAGARRARRGPRVPVPRAPEAAGEAVGVHAVVVAQIVVLPGRPSCREHRFDDQVKDLFLAKVPGAVTAAARVAACRGAAATASVCPAATASVCPAATATVTRRLR